MGSIFVFSLATLISYILIVLNIPYLIIPITLAFIVYVVWLIYKKKIKFNVVFNLKTLIVLIVFTIGIVGQLAIIAPSGTYQSGDLVFWSAHGHDGPWHIALVEEMKKGYPFENPVFAGEKLTNYHFYSDILPTMVSLYTPISDLDSYFRLFPFIYSLFLGASVYFLTKKLTNSFSASIWAVIFTYFAGSFGYIIGKGESVFWATQIQSSSGNPPQIISNFLFLAGIYYVLVFLEQTNKRQQAKYFLVSLVILAVISSFKIYAGFVLLLTLAIVGTWNLIFKKDFRLFVLALISGVAALAIYLPNSANSASFLIYEPWWYIRTMIVEPSRLNLLDWELRRQTYIVESNWKRVIWLEGMGFLIFFFGNLGMRFIGLWEFLKTNLIFKVAIVISIIMPLLFLQKGVASNTAQFLQYFILLFGILSGIAISKLANSKIKTIVLGTAVIILMVPTQLTLLRDFYVSEGSLRQPFTRVSSSELEALEHIMKNTEETAVILTPPYNQYLNQKKQIPEIWDWFDTSYVSAFSARRTYFDDYEQVDIMGYDYKPRLKTKELIFNEKNTNKVKEALLSTNADLIYFPKDLKPQVKLVEIGLTLFYENSNVEVWRIN